MKTFVVVPTYNEAKNINKLIPAIISFVPAANLLVVDDNSPDGTARNVTKWQKKYPGQIHLLVRKKERGRGSAGLSGFKYALLSGADVVVEMDADFSHDPKYLPAMLSYIGRYDVVVGSRFVRGGQDRRGPWRSLVTLLGHFYLNFVLSLKLTDPTSGYRVFTREVLVNVGLDNFIATRSWAVVQETLYRAVILKFRVKEVPIVFVDRDRGKSKFNLLILGQGAAMALILRLMLIFFHKEMRRT